MKRDQCMPPNAWLELKIQKSQGCQGGDTHFDLFFKKKIVGTDVKIYGYKFDIHVSKFLLTSKNFIC